MIDDWIIPQLKERNEKLCAHFLYHTLTIIKHSQLPEFKPTPSSQEHTLFPMVYDTASQLSLCLSGQFYLKSLCSTFSMTMEY